VLENSGSSADNHKTRVALAQYSAPAPLSAGKLSYLPSNGTVRYTSDFNPAIGDTTKVWDACYFIAAATYFGLYSSRSHWQRPR
jgi:hypothetical protein